MVEGIPRGEGKTIYREKINFILKKALAFFYFKPNGYNIVICVCAKGKGLLIPIA